MGASLPPKEANLFKLIVVWFFPFSIFVELCLRGLDSYGLDCEDLGRILAGEWFGGIWGGLGRGRAKGR